MLICYLMLQQSSCLVHTPNELVILKDLAQSCRSHHSSHGSHWSSHDNHVTLTSVLTIPNGLLEVLHTVQLHLLPPDLPLKGLHCHHTAGHKLHCYLGLGTRTIIQAPSISKAAASMFNTIRGHPDLFGMNYSTLSPLVGRELTGVC